nr:receptor-type tyrosine-protein phosphatase kappa isoform X5 [Crassostrea gigas]
MRDNFVVGKEYNVQDNMCGYVMLYIVVSILFPIIPVCALENIALNKPTWQQHPWPQSDRDYGSENAVDGFYTDRGTGGQCTINNDGQYTAEWRVDLGNVLSISYINIYYRTQNENPGPYVNRMAGFSLYISNTTSKDQGHCCYKDNSRGKPSVNQNISCSIYGRYVIYYNERSRDDNPSYLSKYAYNELCELEVFGYRGSFGDCCQYPCHENCIYMGCDAYTGHCRSFIPEHYGQICIAECPPGYYGNDCRYQCSVNCYGDRSCDQSTGQCEGGCQPGWSGDTCDQWCGFGYYGKDCRHRCSVNCSVAYYCDRSTGQCIGGCKPGWTGFMCDQVCESGYYGQNCINQCSINCNVFKSCDRVTGKCYFGCKPGWSGNTCDQVVVCQPGYYGVECKQQCSINCNVTTQCNKVTGQCEGGCKPGWKGSTCNQMCESGYYGKNCSNQCSTNCDMVSSCDKVTGECDGGCNAGWAGIHCNQACSTGFYGKNCSEQCNNNCNETTKCNRFTGDCNGGCKPGWTGITCNDACEKSYYGTNCTNKCRRNCVNASCDHVNGDCINIQFLKDGDSNDIPTLRIIGGSVAALVILIVIIAIFIMYKRIRCSSGGKHDERHTNATEVTMAFSNLYQNLDIHVEDNANVNNSEIKPTLKPRHKRTEVNKSVELKDEDIDIDEKIHEENPYGDFYVNEEPLIDIEIKRLGYVIEEKSKDENDGFKKEYATLLYGEKYSCDIGKRPENIPKNRFKTTFPYDHSRVILASKHADYVNANYIDGSKRKKMYIAAQGPKENTLADFWLMIWQEDVKQVIMLTNLMEGIKWKCVQYWPSIQTTMACGSFTIQLLDEKQYAFYNVRKLEVNNKKHKDDRRIITQYHYIAWPDHGTPEPLCLLLFHDQVTRTNNGSHTGPILVHCSAGIGRTGTYIAIDVLSETGKTHNKINIAEYVKKMRRNRMNMVQTYEQYKTIFLTLHEMFKAQPTVLCTAEFLHKSQTDSSAFKKEFQKLLAVRPLYTEKDYKVTSQFHDLSASVHPLDRYVLFLTSNIPKRGRYINAISVPSFTHQTAFILTNFPTQGGAVDFLRLITDYDSDVVVCLEPLCNMESASKWHPTKTGSKTVNPFTIKLQHEQTTEIKSSKLEITKEGKSDETWSVDMAEPMDSLQANNAKTVSHILSLVSFARNIETEGPITVISRDGATMCGVFCAVYNLIQQLTMDEEIDVFYVVRLLQTRRPELCSSMEEYQLIHEALRRFIRSHAGENVYYNQ